MHKFTIYQVSGTVLLFLVSLSAAAAAADGVPPRLVSATFLGTDGDDDFQDAAIAEDGTIYVTGNFDRELTKLPQGVTSVSLGQPTSGTWFRCGVVAMLNTDGTRMLRCAQFARGQVFLTTVLPKGDSVYIGGYAVREFQPLIESLDGLFSHYEAANSEPLDNPLPGEPAPPDASLPARPEQDALGKHEVLTIRTRHHGDKDAIPFVLQLTKDLDRIVTGTFLEGHLYAWNIAMPAYEEEWTPVGLATMPGGDLAVLHDGGAPVHHYYAPDYISRLSPDLKNRKWRFDIFFPEIQPIDKIRQRRDEFTHWRFPILGQIRTLRMRGDGTGNIYAGGWSVSMTSSEPWWCSFLLKVDARGKLAWKAYSHDPMSGPGDRMGGLVSDSAIRSMAIDDEGELIVAGISDGGNTILRKDPRDYQKSGPKFKRGYGGMKGRVHYVGHIMRIDARSRELLAGSMFGSYADRGYEAAWAVDVAGLPGTKVLAVGRHNRNHKSTDGAWFDTSSDKGTFVKVLDKEMEELFSTNVPDAIPYAVARKAARCVIVGMSDSKNTPVKEPLQAKPAGGFDAYILVADFPN